VGLLGCRGACRPSGGITQARLRLGYEPLEHLFAGVAAPVAEELTAGAFLGLWRLMAIDGSNGTPSTPQRTRPPAYLWLGFPLPPLPPLLTGRGINLCRSKIRFQSETRPFPEVRRLACTR
jgi:hypothetical protein